MVKVAAELGLTKAVVYKIAKACYTGGLASVEGLRFDGRGRPTKNLFFTQEEIDFMVSKTTLNHQIGMSLPARALEFSKRFGKSINARELRSFYRGRSITL